MAFFNVVSVASTTGYANTDYSRWPVFAPVLMLLLSGVATSAGSTGAGIKMIRVLILVKQASRELSRIVHPRAVNPVTLGNRTIPPGAIFAVLAYMLVYGATVVVLGMVLLLTDLDVVTAFTAVLASVNNMGPGSTRWGRPAISGAHRIADLGLHACHAARPPRCCPSRPAPSFWRKGRAARSLSGSWLRNRPDRVFASTPGGRALYDRCIHSSADGEGPLQPQTRRRLQ
jgi:hypothetical protein